MAPASEVRRVQNDGLAVRHWRAAGCSLVGPSHVARGAGCDDAFGWALADPGLVACVCDGAGSARFGADGATALAASVSKGIAAALVTPDARQDDAGWLEAQVCAAVAAARGALEALALDRGAALRDFHATLVGAVLSGGRALLFHIGDGAALAMRRGEGGAWAAAAISPPENGEYGNETYFVTLSDWRERLRFTWVDGFDALLLMTDGVTPFALDRSHAAADSDFLAPLLTMLAGLPPDTGAKVLRNLLAREDVRAACDDDKTLLWITGGGARVACQAGMDLAARIVCRRRRRCRHWRRRQGRL
ncbi:PP2C family serine/threonine-protein phosphatase [Sphingomonas sp. KR3-1]|uniref:PP2C family serine/threonine-protein phosphatase n=1 Tax=Sphingomonas sp. KR3-1 TaxID=3156611 RepID=UPI0032B4A5D7